MVQKNRWHPVMLPDDYADAQRTVRCGDGFPITGGFASLQPEDAEYAAEVCRQQDSIVRCCVQLRLEPEHLVPPKRQRPADAKR